MELAREYRAVLENILLTRGARRMAERLREVTDASQIADLVGLLARPLLAQKVEVLETVDLEARLRLVLGWARETLADLTLREQIKTNVEEGMEKTQREFLLRRQLEAIRKELNELDGTTDEGSADDYRQKVEEPRPPRGRANGGVARGRQVRAHQRAEPRARLDPDVARHDPRDPLGRARPRTTSTWRPPVILDEDHDGLTDVKERILEHLAVRKLQAERGLVTRRGRAAPARSWPSSVLPESARPRSASRWRAPLVGSSSGSPWVACATRPRSVDTAVPTSAPSPAVWHGRCARRGP